MKNLFLKFSWLPVLLLLTACWKEPSFPKEPNITFSSITPRATKDKFNNPIIRIKVALNFQDGDGNLGLGIGDTLAPFDDVPGNKFKNNYFVDAFVKYPGQTEFSPYNPSTITYTGRFMRLGPDNGIRPLEGELRYEFDVYPGFDLQNGDQMKFRIQIVDRNLNLSNSVETDPITIAF